ncbi:MAG: PGPGW domain-containing protein [Desulfobulbaceae bacterium]
MLPDLPVGYRAILEWLGALSVITFIGSLLVIPWLIGRLPVDYFLRHRHKVEERHKRHPIVARLIFVMRNGLGLLFLLAGMVMLILPGQGIITLLIGFSFMDFRKKHALEDALIHRPGVARALNWVRRKQKKQPFAF